MIVFDNRTTGEFSTELLEEISFYLGDDEVELILTDDDVIREVNALHRGKDSATDVLSFPLEPLPGFPLGSIMISMDKAKEAAGIYGHQTEDEIALLFIHGMLHLMGFDHEVDDGEMRQKEEALVAYFALPESLIVRNG